MPLCVLVGTEQKDIDKINRHVPFNIKRFVFLPKSNFPYCASKVKCCGSHTEGQEDTAYKIVACSSLYKSGLTIAAIQQQLGIKSKSTLYRLLRLNGIGPSRK
jgi:hypothetical protein